KNNFKIGNEIFNQCVLFYSIFTGLLISLGRSEWSETIGLVSRYSTFSIAGFISIFFIFLNNNNFKFSKIIKNTMLFTFLISSTFYWIYGIISVKEIYNSKNFYYNLLVDENYGLQKIDYR